MDGRKDQDKVSSSRILPVCRVCGEPGTGFHYGVTTCVACKGFYFRSITRREPYECLKSNLCNIGQGQNANRRKSCPKCRFDKCVAVGMSKEAIKVGRYSLVKKSKDAREATMEQLSSFPLSDSAPFASKDGQGKIIKQDHQILSSADSSLREGRDDNVEVYTDASVVERHMGPMSLATNTDSQRNDDGLLESLMIEETNLNITSNYFDIEGMDSRMQCCDENEYSTQVGTIPKRSTIEREAMPWKDSGKDLSSTSVAEHLYPYSNNDYYNSATASSLQTISSPKSNTILQNSESVSSSCVNTLSSEVLRSLLISEGITSKPGTSLHNIEQMPFVGNELPSSSTSLDVYPPTVPRYQSESTPCSSSTSNFPDKQENLKQPTECNMNISAVSKSKHLKSRDGIESPPNKSQDSETKEEKSLQVSIPKKRKMPPNLFNEHSQPFTLNFFGSNTMSSVLSMFESFPFKSFEKDSLAPILKVCTGVDYHLGTSLAAKERLLSTAFLRQRSRGIPSFDPKSLRFDGSLELISSADDLKYDASEMDRLFDYFQEIHSRHYGPKSTYLTDNEKELSMDMFSKICQLQDSLLGRMNIIDNDTYFNILETTGLDVDKRGQWFLSSMYGDFDSTFTKDVKFIRAFPGFKELSLNDRTLLTKAMFTVFLKLRSFRTTDFERDVYIDEEAGVATRISTLAQVIGSVSGITDLWKGFIAAFKELDISFDELIILKGICVVNPGLCENLENPKLVRHWHNMYLKCLFHLMKKNHGPRAEARFNRILALNQWMARVRQPLMQSRVLAIDTFSRLSKGCDKPLFNEIYININTPE